jgi:hypothetical protein
MARVGDQDRRRRQRRGVQDLAHHPLRREQRLLDVDAVHEPLVDHHLVTVGIDVDRHQFGDGDLFRHPLRGAEQATQPGVLLAQRGLGLQAGLLAQPPGVQVGILLQQPLARGERVAGPVAQLDRQIDQGLQRGERGRQHRTYRLEVVVAVVEGHQHDRRQHQHDQACRQRGPA